MEHGDIIYIVETLSYFWKHDGNDSNDVVTVLKAAINMACQIEHAWNNKKIFVDAFDLRQSIMSWFKLFLSIVKYALEVDDDSTLKQLCSEIVNVYDELSRKF